MFVPSDKNLGPCLIDCNTYIKRALNDHLLDQKTYKQLTDVESDEIEKSVRQQFTLLLQQGIENRNLMPDKITYLKRALQVERTRYPVF